LKIINNQPIAVKYGDGLMIFWGTLLMKVYISRVVGKGMAFYVFTHLIEISETLQEKKRNSEILDVSA